jgi:hypothetical protein
MRDSMIFYRSFFEAVKDLEMEMQGKIFNALFDYALNGNEPELDAISKSLFTLMKPQIDANNKRYENGNKGGRKPKANQSETKTKPKANQTETKVEPNKNENENKNENKNENENENDNGKSKSIQLKTFVRENVSLSDVELEKLLSEHGKEKTDWFLDKLNNYKIASGRKYKSDYHAILNWVVWEYQNKNQIKQNNPIYIPGKPATK